MVALARSVASASNPVASLVTVVISVAAPFSADYVEFLLTPATSYRSPSGSSMVSPLLLDNSSTWVTNSDGMGNSIQ